MWPKPATGPDGLLALLAPQLLETVETLTVRAGVVRPEPQLCTQSLGMMVLGKGAWPGGGVLANGSARGNL